MKTPAFIAAFVALSLSGLAHAQTTDDSPLCTDRPTKANATCPVPQGHWQLETDIGNTVHDAQGANKTDTSYPLNPTLKYGLGGATDLEATWAPDVRVHTRADGNHQRRHGQGDLVVRLKTRLYSSDQASVAIIPFVKAPTARSGLGNDRWEGGLAVPVGVTLPAGFSLTLGPEVDYLADADGDGHHTALSNLVNVAHALSDRLTLAVEYWEQRNWDPAGTIKQQSADVALSFAIAPRFQVDVGANFGLNDQTPDRQFYLGFAHRW
ncbi:transporter [Dyella sp. 333MFSha]|uniref:transporter n=1 Tax=Dyella sp. 333MFSha TaxID=1798240 RepID=UPI00088611A0|nr:transporter [Dyella sp. 333MFSha]SDF40442.1 Putative MetA-pathway of phenol degradation [Dyella sp. 333MFSha]